MRKLVLKLIVVLNLAGATVAQKLTKYGKICDGLDANPIPFPAPVPTTIISRGKITAVNTLIAQRAAKEVEVVTLTKTIGEKMDDLNLTFAGGYMSYVQTQSAGVESVAKSAGYDVKKPGTSAPDVVPPPEGVVTTRGTIPGTLVGHCDSVEGLGIKQFDIQVSYNPNDASPVYVHKMYTSKTTGTVIPGLPINSEVGVRYVAIGKKTGVESIPSIPYIRST